MAEADDPDSDPNCIDCYRIATVAEADDPDCERKGTCQEHGSGETHVSQIG
jgi:hypothetical protein